MAINIMDAGTREQVERAAVMQSVSENKEILKYFNKHPSQEDVCLNDLIKKLDHSDPDVQIMQDYLNRHEGETVTIKNYEAVTGFDDPKKTGEMNAWGSYVTLEVNAPNAKNVYVAYCGTAKGEGVDNGEGMYTESTAQQRAAADYYDRMAEKYASSFQNGKVTVVGHSKGGNKAMFTTMEARHADLIDSCVAMDGQGFSNEAMEKWNANPLWFEQQRDKVLLIAGENDYVHAIANPLVKDDKLYYLNYGPTGETLDAGESFAAYHRHQYLFRQNEKGEFTCELMEETAEGVIPRRIKDFFQYFMTLSPDEKRQTAPGLMEILWGAPSSDGVDPNTYSTLTFTFFELLGAPKETVAALLAVMFTLATDRGENTDLIIEKILSKEYSAKAMDLMIAATMFCLGKLIPSDVKFIGKVMSKTYSAVLAFFRKLNEWEEQKYRKIYENMAAENPEFSVCPEFLIDRATDPSVSRVGSSIAEAQQRLRSVINRTFLTPGWLQILSEGVNPYTVDQVRKLNEGIAIAKQDIHNLNDALRNAADLLESVKETLNGVIGYMYDTGMEFNNAEKTVKDLIADFETVLRLD